MHRRTIMRKSGWMNLLTVLHLSVLVTGCGAIDLELLEEGMTVELGSKLPTEAAAYVTAESYEDITLDTDDVDTQTVGTYVVTVFHKDREAGNVTVTVEDTTAPKASVPDSSRVEKGTSCTVEDYVSDIQDLSETESFFLLDSLLPQDAPKEELNLKEENLVKRIRLSQEGNYRVNIAVWDVYGNYTVYPLCMEVYTPDTQAPVITAEDLTVEAGKDPDYLDGVTAEDDVDGNLTEHIKADTSQVLLDQAGSYPVIYSVRDAAGNEGRKEVVLTIKAKKVQAKAVPATTGQQADPPAPADTATPSAEASSDTAPAATPAPAPTEEPAAPVPEPVPVTPAPAPTPTPEPTPIVPAPEPAVTAGFDSAKADELLALVNAERQALGGGTVSRKESLVGHATEMAQSGDIDGSGVIGCKGTGATSASIVMAHWKENWPEGTWTTAAWKYVGAACYHNGGNYTWVMVFGAY